MIYVLFIEQFCIVEHSSTIITLQDGHSLSSRLARFLGGEGSQDVTVVGGNGVVVVEDKGTGVKGVKMKQNSSGLASFAVVGKADKAILQYCWITGTFSLPP